MKRIWVRRMVSHATFDSGAPGDPRGVFWLRRSSLVALIGAFSLVMGAAGAAVPISDSSLGDAYSKLVGDVPGQGAGYHVAPAGDLDGDGFDDVVVGAWLDDTVGPSAGAAYVLYGPIPEGVIDLADADAKLLPEATGDFAGEGYAGAGDLDGDGFDDLVVGAPGRDPALGQPGTAAPGAAYVFYGSADRLSGTMSLTEADAKLLGESDVDFAGLALSSATDLDGDGSPDLVVSASRDDAGGPEAGAVYVFYGGGRLSGTISLAAADAKLLGAPRNLAGFRLDGAGDLDGDGFGELVIGAPSISAFGGTAVGATYVLYGSPARLAGTLSLPAIAARLVGEENDDRPGFGLAGAGDLDDDGFDDLIVGADLEDTGGTNAGAAYVFYGSASRLAGTVNLKAADAKLIGEAARDRAGFNVTIAKVDGGPFDELVVGAHGHSAAGPGAGAAYVFFGKATRLTGAVSLADADAKLLGEAGSDMAGFAVGPAGDANGDGYHDLMVGAYGHRAGTGAVYVLTHFDLLHGALDALAAAGGITGYTEAKIRHALDTAELWLRNPRKLGPALSHLARAMHLLRWQADVVDRGKPNQGVADGLRALADAIEEVWAARGGG